ncbi:hypothetical protein TTHERM_002653364, partial (macronuclear) [Tetrahymena thermophila SB210]
IDYIFFIICGFQIMVYKARQNNHIFCRFIQCILKKVLTSRYYNYYVFSSKTSYQTYLYWKLIRKNISKIIQSKASQNMSIQSSRLISQNNSQRADTNENMLSLQTQIHKYQKRFFQNNQILSPNRKKQNSHFKLLAHNFNADQDNQNFKNDFILESEQNEQLEISDPKKVEIYNFSPKSSIFNSKIQFYHKDQSSILNN